MYQNDCLDVVSKLRLKRTDVYLSYKKYLCLNVEIVQISTVVGIVS